jgi:hypothetical protein
MKYTVYNNSGEILELISISNLDMVNTILQDQLYLEGHYNPSLYYVDQGQACAKSPQPTHEYIQYSFDYATKSWTVDTTQSVVSARYHRDQLLSAIDRVNPVWYASLTAEQQNDLVVYRQQLLDVPQQTSFPSDVTWPAKPAWL